MAGREIVDVRSLVFFVLSRQWPYYILVVVAYLVPNSLRFVVISLCALVISTSIHEAGHICAFWLLNEVSAVRIYSILGVFFRVRVHSEPTRLIALMGPLAPSLLGVLLILLGCAINETVLIILGSAHCMHLVGLLPGNSDGDKIWGLSAS